MDSFISQTPKQIGERITVESFLGAKILRVDGRRVGHALSDDEVERMKHFLVRALPDCEAMFMEMYQRGTATTGISAEV